MQQQPFLPSTDIVSRNLVDVLSAKNRKIEKSQFCDVIVQRHLAGKASTVTLVKSYIIPEYNPL
jgi:hypothetical protein